MIRILLVDDQENVRQGLKMRLSLETDMSVVGEAGNGKQAVELAQVLEPDVIIMDVEMPIMDGIQAAQHILDEPEVHTCIVMLSIHSDTESCNEAYAAGACGFVEKNGDPDNLLGTIRLAATQIQGPEPPG